MWSIQLPKIDSIFLVRLTYSAVVNVIYLYAHELD